MKAAFLLFLLALLPAGKSSSSFTAESILLDSRNRVAQLERVADSSNGSLTVSVSFKANILGKTASGNAKYKILVKDGRDNGNQLVGAHSFSDSSVVSMMNRELRRRLNKPIMNLYLETAFPWARFVRGSEESSEFAATMVSDSEVFGGRRCFLISFELHAESDSVSADGDGKIWIDSETLLPVRTYRDFNMRTRRGRAEVKSYSDFSRLDNGLPVMLRSETQTIPKFLFVSVGSIKTVVEQSDFNLE